MGKERVALRLRRVQLRRIMIILKASAAHLKMLFVCWSGRILSYCEKGGCGKNFK